MPPRRSHKKSKAGCQRCKHRKIKCDEVHPHCGNCLKHGVACDFDGPTFTPPNEHDSPRITASTPGSVATAFPQTPFLQTPFPQTPFAQTPFPQTPSDVVRHVSSGFRDRETNRSLELRLLHHYTAITSQTLSMTASQKHAWQVDVPIIAYEAQYLMDAILAVAALHLRSIHPNDQTYVRASHSYMASALAQYSSLLNKGLSEHNTEALFATSALIAFQASASRRFDAGDGLDSYVLPLAWFHSFQGVKTVVMASWQWLRHSDRIFPIINGQPALRLDLDPERRSFFKPLLEGIEQDLKRFEGVLYEETKGAYEHAIAFLDWAHRKPERNRILGFAATVSRRFVELVSMQDSRALVIISCFFAMTKVIDEVWWLQGVAKREVMGVMSMLPREWWPRMDWAVRIANSVGPIDEDAWGGCWHSEGAPKAEEGFCGQVQEHIDIMLNNMAAPSKTPKTATNDCLDKMSEMIPPVGVD